MARSRKGKFKTGRASRSQGNGTSTECTTQSFYDVVTYAQVPFYSWVTYFYNQDYDENSATAEKIIALIEFFERFPSMITTFDIEKGLNLDMNLCFKDAMLRHKWTSVIEEFNENPRNTLNCFCAAFFEVIMRWSMENNDGNVMKTLRTLQLIRINMINYEPIHALSYLKLSSYGKLISISGIVISIGTPKFALNSVTFVCRCKRQMIAKQQNETYSVPKKCNVCGNGQFKRLLDSPYETMIASQTIHIKDCRSLKKMIDAASFSPDSVPVKLTHSLVDKFMPGDQIKIIGIPQMPVLGNGAVKSSTPGSCPLYVEAISIFKNDALSKSFIKERTNMEAIESIRSEPNLFSLLVHSLCPAVQGHGLVKAALVLGLFGGSPKNNDIRDYVHILIIGNLGVGKTQLLRACVDAVKGVYIHGSSSISLEPTIINVRENGTEDFRFESGALNSDNVDLCCIDELNKMSSQHQTLHNAMDSRRVNLETQLRLPVRAPIFATINPIKRRYDSSKTVIENVNAYEPLLSQFDLVFLMRDHPDTYLDKLMCDRMLEVHANKRIRLSERSSSSRVTNGSRNRDCSLREQLANSEESTIDTLPQQLLRMYINYARWNINSEISNASKAVLYVYISRQKYHGNMQSVDRLIRILIILTEARAKLDLRSETTEQDAYDVIAIMEASISIYTKDQSQVSSSNSKKLTANKVKQFLEDLRNEAILLNKNTFTIDELHNIAGKENITENILANLVTNLNEQGYLLKISPRVYKFVYIQ